eukprot:454919_1
MRSKTIDRTSKRVNEEQKAHKNNSLDDTDVPDSFIESKEKNVKNLTQQNIKHNKVAKVKSDNKHSHAAVVQTKPIVEETIPLNNQQIDISSEEFVVSEYCIVNNYLYLHGRFVRFIPSDMIQILPHFFNIKTQHQAILKNFELYYETLWHLPDDILTYWNRKHIDSNYKTSKIKTQIYFDHIRDTLAKLCKMENKVIYNKTNKTIEKNEIILRLQNSIEDDINQKYPWEAEMKFCGCNLDNDIIITNGDDEYYVPSVEYETGQIYERKTVSSWMKQYNLSIEHLKMMPVLYDVWAYSSSVNLITFNDIITKLKIHNQTFQYEWKKYKLLLPVMTEKPGVLIRDTILDYHFCICALSHVLRNLDSFAPFQINSAIISHKLGKVDINKEFDAIDIDNILRKNQIRFVKREMHRDSICEAMNIIAHALWDYTGRVITTNQRWIVVFDMQQDEIIIYVYQNKPTKIFLETLNNLDFNSMHMNLSGLIPNISNNNPKLFILNTYYAECGLVRSYFMREGKILRFFPEHMEYMWPNHFLMSDTETSQIILEHKYRHSYGLQLPDQFFCKIYYSITGGKFLSTHYYRKYHPEITKEIDISLQNIKIDFKKLQEDDKKTYAMNRFSALCKSDKIICSDETKIDCTAVDRLSFMLEQLEHDQMNLLGYVLRKCSINQAYDINRFDRDIDHIKSEHFNVKQKLRQYIIDSNNKVKDCFIRLACSSLRRYTRSETEQGCMIATTIAKNNIEEKIKKAQSNANLTLIIIQKQLDKLHCNIFHSQFNGKQRVDFRRLFVDYSNYSYESVQDLINYMHDITFEFDRKYNDEIKSKLEILFTEFQITPQILYRATEKDLEELIRHKSDIENVESHLNSIVIKLKTQTKSQSALRKEEVKKDEEQKITNKKSKQDINDISLKLYMANDVDQWLSRNNPPLHKDLKHELLCNSSTPLQLTQFVTHKADCVAKYQHKQFNDERLSLTDILALSSFTDFDALQKTFSQCYFNDEYHIERAEFYHWANKLKQAIHYIGRKCNQKLYRGLNSMVLFESLSPMSKQPTSFTFTKKVAEDFANYGIVIECVDVIGFNLNRISVFESEDEFWSYGSSFTINKIIIRTTNFKDQLEFLRRYIQNIPHKIPTINIFQFLGTSYDELLLTLLSMQSEMIKITKYEDFTALQRLFFESKQYHLFVVPFWDNIQNIESCNSYQIVYLLNNYIFTKK